jgi:SulP family sulfate permease
VAVIEDNGSARLGRLARHLPVLEWGRSYGLSTFTDDRLAAAIVTVMLVPQSLAYAMLAGLTPELGLYASILPLVVYALFGTSRTLAVGPVAVISLMTAAAVGQLALPGPAEYAAAAGVLALLSGAMLLLMGPCGLAFSPTSSAIR